MSELHFRLVNIVTEYDRRQSKRANYNRYALGHYMNSVHTIVAAVETDGLPLERALKLGFCGSLLKHVAKKLGLTHQYEKWE
jgi:exonuclease VII small subunit